MGGTIRFHPFRAWRPAPELAERVVAPPYDVVTRAEAAALAAGNPFSFLHVGRSDIDLPEGTDPYDPRVYARAKQNLDRFCADGDLVREAEPTFYVYQLATEQHAQAGVVGCVHIDDYARNLIRKHEKTRPDKEDDRTRHVLAANAHAEPVILTHAEQPFITQMTRRVMAGAPLYDLVRPDGVRHRVWRVSDPGAYADAFRRVQVAYVADGHHRCASALRAGMERRAANPRHTGDEEYNWFLAVLFPAGQLRILAYNRVVSSLNGRTPAEFLVALAGVGTVTKTEVAAPDRPGSFGVFLGGGWYRLALDPASVPPDDPVAGLDASLLQDRVLGPLLDIGDARTDPRIDFVGGGRGVEELERRVAGGQATVAFALHPVTVEQLMAIADAGAVMPPKSTWFEPKLLSGLFVHTLD
ncbi:MAG TPA: DUF1015 family protein [Gemmatimonadales bacterium]|nr:DUF1015 family protein [Gemmatimonadales bacterium]